MAYTVAKTIETASRDFMPAARTMRTTIKDPDTIEACFAWAIDSAVARSPIKIDPEPRLSHDPFLALRRSHGRP